MTLKYIGNAFLRGVPARDLTDEEAEKYGGEVFLVGTGLYTSLVFESGKQFLNGIIAGLEKSEREQQAPAAPIEKPKRQTKKADWKQLAEDG